MKHILYLLLATITINLQAQETTKIQPKIMVIPFAKKGESLRTVLESDGLQRVAATKAKEGFDSRGINTIDLRAKLKQVSNTEVLAEDANNDLKSQLISLSGADIYVEVEATKKAHYKGNTATVILTAYDAFTGQSFSNKVATSPSFRTENYGKLVEKAIVSIIEDFINTIQEKFDDVVANGRSLVVDISISETADYDFDLELNDGSFLSEAVEDWIEENAYKNYYHIQGTTGHKMIFDDVKVPLTDPKNGKPFRINRFANKIKRFFKKLDIEADRTVQGGNIVIVLQ